MLIIGEGLGTHTLTECPLGVSASTSPGVEAGTQVRNGTNQNLICNVRWHRAWTTVVA